MVESLDRADEAEVALLDEVEQTQSRTLVATGYRHNEAQVALDELGAGVVAGADLAHHLGTLATLRGRIGVETLLGELRLQDDGGKSTLIVGGEEGVRADVVEVLPQQFALGISGSASHGENRSGVDRFGRGYPSDG